MTSVHPTPFDVRVFHKEAKTLVKAGYTVSLIAQHNKNEIADEVNIIALPKPHNRFFRIFVSTWKLFRLALKQKADIYHFHDPELLFIGILLKIFTKASVIYDVHEDFPGAILTKEWIFFLLRNIISKIVCFIERVSSVFFDAVIVAGKDIPAHFPSFAKITLLRNFPFKKLAIKTNIEDEKLGNSPILIYTGGLNKDKGIKELISAITFLKNDVLLKLIGRFDFPYFEKECRNEASEKVIFAGYLPYHEMFSLLRKADIGLLPYHPIPNNFASSMGERNNKIFEYMAAGLPVIASNFPAWEKMLKEENCGIPVDPLNPKEIAKAIEYLIEHPDIAKNMGENGKRAVLDKYNWENESKILLELYKELLR